MASPQWTEGNTCPQLDLATPSRSEYQNADVTIRLPTEGCVGRAEQRVPSVPRSSSGPTRELNALIDAHLEWQEGRTRPASRGTLFVDWDGSGLPVVSYRWVERGGVRSWDDGGEEDDAGDAEATEEAEGEREDMETMKVLEEEEEEDLVHTLVPSPLRSVASASMPSSPIRSTMPTSMPSSLFQSTLVAPMPSSPRLMGTMGSLYQRRLGSGQNLQKPLPPLPGETELPLTEENGEWEEEVVTGNSRSSTHSYPASPYASGWSHSLPCSSDLAVENKLAMQPKDQTSDVEGEEKEVPVRQENKGVQMLVSRMSKRGMMRDLGMERLMEKSLTKLEVLKEEKPEWVGSLKGEWQNAKRVFKKFF